MDKKINILLVVVGLITVLNFGLVFYVWQYTNGPRPLPNVNLPGFLEDWQPNEIEGVAKFESAEDFKNYLTKIPEDTGMYSGRGTPMMLEESPAVTDSVGLSAPKLDLGLGGGPGRVSTTNVQVVGIDEPDIVKTNGQEIYFSSNRFSNQVPVVRESDELIITPEPPIPPRDMRPGSMTKIINAWPPADLEVESDIDKQGDLLLHDNILIIFEYDEITAYDVSEPASPEEKWSIELEDRNNIITARLYDNMVYLVTRTSLNRGRPCPIEPLSVNGQTLSIACNEIYHPIEPINVDVNFSVMQIDPQNGQVKDKTAFVGSSGNSIIYMSDQAVYVTYNYPGDYVGYILNFFKENSDIVPDWVINDLAKLQSYDLSQQAKMAELMNIIQQFMLSLDEDEALRLENEFTNRMDDYAAAHARDLEQTGIIKINIDGLNLAANGSVPGTPLNQFSLDEYENNLRIATTTGRNVFAAGLSVRSESVNDVYVLDENLKQSGSVLDLGLTERIYSVRFLQDKGYVVTFRQIDPFYVLDLADPQNPQMKGELKIPGYSSYLHPITKDKILGIGEEDNRVKISLFDVADPINPQEIAKYNLEDYYTEINQNHHAFLLDQEHQVFFLPGARGGYVFSYENNELSLERAISDIRARRAIYLDDYMYIVGDDRLLILNESDWQEVNELEY